MRRLSTLRAQLEGCWFDIFSLGLYCQGYRPTGPDELVTSFGCLCCLFPMIREANTPPEVYKRDPGTNTFRYQRWPDNPSSLQVIVFKNPSTMVLWTSGQASCEGFHRKIPRPIPEVCALQSLHLGRDVHEQADTHVQARSVASLSDQFIP